MSTIETLPDELSDSELGSQNGEIMQDQSWFHDCRYRGENDFFIRDHSELFPWGAKDGRHFDENNNRKEGRPPDRSPDRPPDEFGGIRDGQHTENDTGNDPFDKCLYINKQERNSLERDNSADRDADINRKLKLVKQDLEWSQESGKSFRQFFREFLFHYQDYLGLSEQDLKYYFSQRFTNPDMRTHVQDMIRISPEISLNELAAKIAYLYTNDSHLYYRNKLKSFRQKRGEGIGMLSFRLRSLYDETISPSDFFWFKDTATYEEDLLFHFYSALRNPELVRELLRRDVKTLNSAVQLANSIIQAEQSVQIYSSISTKNSKLPMLTIKMEAALMSREKIKDNHLTTTNVDTRDLDDHNKSSFVNTMRNASFLHRPCSDQASQMTSSRGQGKHHYAKKGTRAMTKTRSGLKLALSNHTQPITADVTTQLTPKRKHIEKDRPVSAFINKMVEAQEAESQEQLLSEKQSHRDNVEDVNETSEPESDKLIESSCRLVNNVEVRKQKESITSKTISRVSVGNLENSPDFPAIEIEGLGNVLCYSGSEVSLIHPDAIPLSFNRQRDTSVLQGFDGEKVTAYETVTIGLKKETEGFSVTNTNAETTVTFVISDLADGISLSYNDICKLGVTINEQKVYDRFMPETDSNEMKRELDAANKDRCENSCRLDISDISDISDQGFDKFDDNIDATETQTLGPDETEFVPDAMELLLAPEQTEFASGDMKPRLKPDDGTKELEPCLPITDTQKMLSWSDADLEDRDILMPDIQDSGMDTNNHDVGKSEGINDLEMDRTTDLKEIGPSIGERHVVDADSSRGAEVEVGKVCSLGIHIELNKDIPWIIGRILTLSLSLSLSLSLWILTLWRFALVILSYSPSHKVKFGNEFDKHATSGRLIETSPCEQNFSQMAKIPKRRDSKHELRSLDTDSRFGRIKQMELTLKAQISCLAKNLFMKHFEQDRIF